MTARPQFERRVTFAGIGVQKSATGWLFRALEEHPGVATPRDPWMKEVNYFNHEWHCGHGWYESLFPEPDGRPTGEFSVLYAADVDVPRRMRLYNGDMRLVLCLRDPIERAFSQHRYLVGRGMVPDHLHGFGDAWEMNPSYAEQSTYADVIERFAEAFSLEHLLVLDYDDVRTRPTSVLERLFRHLGADPDHVPVDIDRRYNESRRPRNAVARELRKVAVGGLRELPDPIAGRLRRARIAGRVSGALTRPVDGASVPPLSDVERRDLRAFFEPDVRRVRALVDGVGARWLAPGSDA